MLSDIEIAQRATLKPIAEIAAELGLPEAAIEPYGRTKAKVALDWLAAPPATVARRWCRWRTSTSTSPTASTRSASPTTRSLR